MNDNNLIAHCWVIQKKENKFIHPTIFLSYPPHDQDTEILHLFYNPFDAKKFIREFMGNCCFVKITNEVNPDILELVVCN